ncbi:MAG: 1-acyl-sn-glycerol-3-phosphate acyltransferase [Spirochaetia bacterium]|nr:1-acyl-sn-glycerol-3-phosphate acyltransferase [Spirochaetia bacterium]
MKRLAGALFWIIWFIPFLPTTFLCAMAIIIFNIIWFNKSDRKTRFLRKIYRLWGRLTIFYAFSPVKVVGYKKDIPKPTLIISNHQSDFDIYAGGFYPVDFLFLSKKEVFEIPLIGTAMRNVEFLSVDRNQPEKAAVSLLNLIRKIKQKKTILIYPEGTRSEDASNMLPFKNGSLIAARQAKIPITPIVIHGTQLIKPPKKKFYIMPHKIYIDVLKPIYPDDDLHPSNANSPYSEEEQSDKIRELMQRSYHDLKLRKFS